MRIIITTAMILALFMAGCQQDLADKTTEKMYFISLETQNEVIEALVEKFGEEHREWATRGVGQVAALWEETDGTAKEFSSFCLENFTGSAEAREELFDKLTKNYEVLWGSLHQINVDFNKGVHLDIGLITPIDMMFAGYSPYAHLADDFFKNKIAFVTILNFPHYSLDEKYALGESWSRKEWAYARMGDIFTSRVPSAINQESTQIATASESYISEYNIVMDNLLDENGNTLFTGDKRLITHWGLRDELKSQYGNEDGLARQRMIHQVMLRIIGQDIPEMVINNPDYQWNPFTNQVFQNNSEVEATPEPDTRYRHLLNAFQVGLKVDKYSPNYPTAIERAFNQGLEMTMEEVEALFVEVLSSPLFAQVGELISERLGRPLEPFDIWYDGFKTRSAIPEEELTELVRKRHATAEEFEKEMEKILLQLGWTPERARSIASKIVVEGSRGPGHAWGARMRSQPSYLRTRIPADGMDYKGYNIAMHELGHNVEQTITLHDVDYYMMNGVPNTAFTEALAFIFQVRDLEVLGLKNEDPNQEHLNALDVFWGTCEIMGVALVDAAVWRWMYENPDATPAELKENVIRIAKEVWNTYFTPAFGIEDSPILGIYSHMINYPLYLSAYPLGHLIEFQLEAQLDGLKIGNEMDRVFSVGNLVPNHWMEHAVNGPVSGRPMLDAIEKALAVIRP